MERVLLTDVCNFQYGYAFDSRKFSNEGKVPLVRIRDVVRGYSETYTDEDFDDNYLVHDGDMLIGMDGEFNIAYWHGGDAALNQRVCKLVPSDKVDSAYIFYRMVSVLKQIESKTPFVTVKHLSAKELNAVYIDLPNISEQEMQGKKLRYIDGLIAKNDSKLKIMDILVKSRFIEMFGDLETNPKGWKTTTFDDVSVKITDGEHATVPRVEDGYIFLNARNVLKAGKIDLTGVTYISEENHNRIYKRCNPEPGDILLTTTGTIGNVAIVPEMDAFSMDRGITLIKQDRSVINSVFFAVAIQMDSMQMHMKNGIHASAIGHLFMNKVKALPIFVPPLDLQNQFADFVALTDKSKLAVQRSIETLQTLKAKLMQDYFG